MDIEKLIEQLNDFNENHIAVLCGSGQCACGYLCDKDDCIVVRAASALSTLQAENEKLRETVDKYAKAARVIALHLKPFCDESLPYDEMIADAARKASDELEQVKRCIEIVENQRDAAIYDMTALIAGQCCDLCAVEYCSDRSKAVMCTAFKWRGQQKED